MKFKLYDLEGVTKDNLIEWIGIPYWTNSNKWDDMIHSYLFVESVDVAWLVVWTGESIPTHDEIQSAIEAEMVKRQEEEDA